jgi:hypothetical protein
LKRPPCEIRVFGSLFERWRRLHRSLLKVVADAPKVRPRNRKKDGKPIKRRRIISVGRLRIAECTVNTHQMGPEPLIMGVDCEARRLAAMSLPFALLRHYSPNVEGG